MLLKLYAKCCQANSTDKAFHTPWCHIICSLWWVSLAEYILVLRVYSLLLQMICCIMGTVRTAFILPWMRTKPWGMVLLSYPLCSGFARMIVALACIWTKCDVDVKLLCFRYLNLVCNNYELQCMWDTCELFVNCDVTCDWLCWIMYDLGLFEILRDFIGLLDLYGLKYDDLIASVIAIVLVLL